MYQICYFTRSHFDILYCKCNFPHARFLMRVPSCTLPHARFFVHAHSCDSCDVDSKMIFRLRWNATRLARPTSRPPAGSGPVNQQAHIPVGGERKETASIFYIIVTAKLFAWDDWW